VSTERMEAFSDGVFAVAITLLILDVHVPFLQHGALVLNAHLWRALTDQWVSYVTYIVSFIIIGIMWVNHHSMFCYVVRVDRPFLFFNLLLLMCIAFIPFSTALLSAYIQQPDSSGNSFMQNSHVAAAIYGAVSTATGFAFGALWSCAVLRNLIEGLDPVTARRMIPRFASGTVVYALSIVVAFVNPKLSLALFFLLAVFYAFDQLPAPVPAPSS